MQTANTFLGNINQDSGSSAYSYMRLNKKNPTKELCSYVFNLTNIALDERGLSLLLHTARYRTLRRRQFLLQDGDVCNYLTLIIRGALRMYYVNSRGQETTIDISVEHDWIADYESLGRNIPSKYNIETLEDTEVIQFEIDQLEDLRHRVPAVEQMMRILTRQHAIAKQERIHAAICMTAEEKYHDLLQRNPSFPQRFSQNLLASYLGIKPETLSRVRKRH